MAHANVHMTREHLAAVSILISKLLLNCSLVWEAKSIKRAEAVSEFWNQHNKFERHDGMYDEENVWINTVYEPAHDIRNIPLLKV